MQVVPQKAEKGGFIMSKTISNNQPTSTLVTTHNAPVPNWRANYRITSDKAGDVALTCVKTPLGADSEIILKSSTIPNVYKGAGSKIPATMRGLNNTGVKVLLQTNETWTVSDSADATFGYSLPVSAHLVLSIPNDSMITEDLVINLVDRTVGLLYEKGDDGEAVSRVSAILRQALVPENM